MAIFRQRALDALQRPQALDTPLLLPRPSLREQLPAALAQLAELLAGSRRRQHTPELLQQDPTECGAVSLSILLQHHGRYVPLAELRQACGVSRDGSDAANLVRAAQRYGLQAKGFKKGLGALKAVALPAVIFWNFEHFLVLEAQEEGRFWLNDPASGRRCVDLATFDRSYTGVVLTMEPGPDFLRQGRAPQPPQLLLNQLRQQGEPWMALLLALALAALGLGLAPTLLTGALLAQPLAAAPAIGLAAALVLALAVLARRLNRRLQQRTSLRLQRQLLSLPDWLLSQRFPADLAGRQALLPELQALLSHQLWPALLASAAVLLSALLLLPGQPAAALVILGGGAGVLALGLAEQRQQQSRSSQERIAALRPTAALHDGLRDADTLKASALERQLFQRWSGLEAQAAAQRQRLWSERQLADWLPELLGRSLPLLALGLGCALARQGLLGLAALAALQLVCLALAEAQRRSRALIAAWPAAGHQLLRLEDVLEQPADPLLLPAVHGTGPGDGPGSGERLDGLLETEELSFGYVPVQKPLISGLSLRLEPGQRLALVGGSASGKSTVARLLAGLLQPTGGQVLLDGRPLLEWPRATRLQAIAMVQQSSTLLSCSLRENLSFWDPSIPLAELEQACADAAILERITALPQGFNTPLLEAGRQLSGGERQRLAIAQALLQKPAVLILDEASAALDALTEQQVEQALRRLGCSQVVVAHRLSTIRDADEILVLDRGQVVQRGTHAGLAAETSGAYSQLLELANINVSAS